MIFFIFSSLRYFLYVGLFISVLSSSFLYAAYDSNVFHFEIEGKFYTALTVRATSGDKYHYSSYFPLTQQSRQERLKKKMDLWEEDPTIRNWVEGALNRLQQDYVEHLLKEGRVEKGSELHAKLLKPISKFDGRSFVVITGFNDPVDIKAMLSVARSDILPLEENLNLRIPSPESLNVKLDDVISENVMLTTEEKKKLASSTYKAGIVELKNFAHMSKKTDFLPLLLTIAENELITVTDASLTRLPDVGLKVPAEYVVQCLAHMKPLYERMGFKNIPEYQRGDVYVLKISREGFLKILESFKRRPGQSMIGKIRPMVSSLRYVTGDITHSRYLNQNRFLSYGYGNGGSAKEFELNFIEKRSFANLDSDGVKQISYDEAGRKIKSKLKSTFDQSKYHTDVLIVDHQQNQSGTSWGPRDQFKIAMQLDNKGGDKIKVLLKGNSNLQVDENTINEILSSIGELKKNWKDVENVKSGEDAFALQKKMLRKLRPSILPAACYHSIMKEFMVE